MINTINKTLLYIIYAFLIISTNINITYANIDDNDKNQTLKDELNIKWKIGMKWNIKYYTIVTYNPVQGKIIDDDTGKYVEYNYEIIDEFEYDKTKYYRIKIFETSDTPFFYALYDMNTFEMRHLLNKNGDHICSYVPSNLLVINKIYPEYYPAMSYTNYNNNNKKQSIIYNKNEIMIEICDEIVYYWIKGQPWWYKCEKKSRKNKKNSFAITTFIL